MLEEWHLHLQRKGLINLLAPAPATDSCLMLFMQVLNSQEQNFRGSMRCSRKREVGTSILLTLLHFQESLDHVQRILMSKFY